MDCPAGELESIIVEAPCGRLAGLRRGNIFAFKGSLNPKTIRRAEEADDPVPITVANAERIITVLGEKGVKLIEEDGQGAGVCFATLPEPDTAS
jgi:hypothetical protein